MPTLTDIIKATKKPAPKAQMGQVLDPLSPYNKTFRTNISDLVGQNQPGILPKADLSPVSLGNSGFKSNLGSTVKQSNGLKDMASNSLAPGPSQLKTKSPAIGAGAIGGIAEAATGIATGAIDIFSKPTQANTWGIEKKNYSADTAKSALQGLGKGAATGAAIGSIIPGWGTAVGAVVGGLVGGISGLLKGRKQAKADKTQYKDSTQASYEDYNQKAASQQYAAMGKAGVKLAVMKEVKGSKTNAISYKKRKFKIGGKLDKVGEVNVIPSGTLHKENNNLGEKDKGIPIIDEKGNKMFEVEREELILRLSATQVAEDHIKAFKKTNNVRHIVELGKYLTKEIMTNTHDNSGKFGLEVNQ